MIAVLADIEMAGVRIDSGALTENRIETDRREIDPHQLLGTDLNLLEATASRTPRCTNSRSNSGIPS